MKKILKFLFILLAACGVLIGAVLIWAKGQLSKDQPAKPRPTFSSYEMGDGAADGSPKPDATGYVVDSSGRGRILPPMPPERPMDINTTANYKANFKIRSCFWPGPRARSGVFTNDSSSYTMENQFPDTGTTYIPTAFKLPEGAKLVITGDFPHMRHWNYNTYNAKGEPQDAISDVEIDPDQGSSNPFRAGVPRDVKERRYTIAIVNGPVPTPRPKNTLYTRAPAGEEVYLWMRNYVPDHSIDYVGGVPLPSIALHLADGKVLKDEQACEATNTAMRGKQLPSSVNPLAWVLLSHLPWVKTESVGAIDAPAVPMQVFFNRKQVVSDAFLPALHNKEPAQVGGWWSNLATRYGYAYLSREYGKVYVMTAKLPKTPKTWHGETDNTPDADMRYMSVCTGAALTSATTPDCVYDEQLASSVDADGRYLVVIARQDERPKNATEACGVAWLDYGNGDGQPSGTDNYALVINRHTQVNKDFKKSWFGVEKPGTERQVMGEYLPHLLNLKDKANFESLGCPVDKKKLYAMVPRQAD